MASVFDVAVYILEKAGDMTAMKLQKLVYYSQAWHLVWEEKPLFQEKIEAWANGPVVRSLYSAHRGLFKVSAQNFNKVGSSENLKKDERTSIDGVLKFYGFRSSQYLSDLTHMEEPWLTSRDGLGPGERGDNEISHAAMAEYYSSL